MARNRSIAAIYEKVGLPYSLTQLGISLQADLRSVAEKATVAEESIHVMPFPVSADAVVSAIKKIGRKKRRAASRSVTCVQPQHVYSNVSNPRFFPSLLSV